MSMTVGSISWVVVSSVSVVTACGAGLYYGNTQLRHEPPAEIHAAVAAPAVAVPAISQRASGAQDASPVVLATAQAEANAVTTAVAASSGSAGTDESPTFDIARVERNGDAVIAGRAAPGATVELLRNGERLDRAVADRSGEFVMTPPRLPAGNYALTLRSKLPDGTLATSKEVAVAVDAAEPSAGALQSHAELPSSIPETKATSRLSPDVALSRLSHAAAATTALPDAGPTSSAAAEPRVATAIVSRGDSLWRISRITYGAGTRYAVVYKANRDRIRDPNRIYPGQIIILPAKAR